MGVWQEIELFIQQNVLLFNAQFSLFNTDYSTLKEYLTTGHNQDTIIML